MYGEDDFLEAQYEERFISDMDNEPDLYDYSPEDFDQADLDDYSQDYVDNEVEGLGMNKNGMWDALIELGVSEQTLQIITEINGFNERTMKDVLYVHTGYRDFDQLGD